MGGLHKAVDQLTNRKIGRQVVGTEERMSGGQDNRQVVVRKMEKRVGRRAYGSVEA